MPGKWVCFYEPWILKRFLTVSGIDVSHVLVNETRADFHHSDPLRNMLPDPKKDPFAYPELADTYLRAVQEGARGELSIRIPESIEITKVTCYSFANSRTVHLFVILVDYWTGWRCTNDRLGCQGWYCFPF